MKTERPVKTLVVGVSLGADRYANLAVRQLRDHGHDVVGLGLRAGDEAGTPVLEGQPAIDGVDTVTLYINPQRQATLIDYLLSLKPRRVIFNPGTENAEFVRRAHEAGVEPVVGCTLVMLASGRF
jgi:predicted CoA-binding protein